MNNPDDTALADNESEAIVPIVYYKPDYDQSMLVVQQHDLSEMAAKAVIQAAEHQFATPAKEATKQEIERTKQEEHRAAAAKTVTHHETIRVAMTLVVVALAVVLIFINPVAGAAIAASIGVVAAVLSAPKIIKEAKKKAKLDD